MWRDLFLCLYLAHLVADFFLQTSKSCRDKVLRKWRSPSHYIHAAIVFALSWLVSWKVDFWWCAVIISVSHFVIDMWKSYRSERVEWFIIDQILHLFVIAGIGWLWVSENDWSVPFGMKSIYMATAVAILVCWKPANIFIKLMLGRYSVNMPKEKDSGFNAGALIGTVERWLILIFMCLNRYEALGLLIAAKSIIRFSEKDTAKTEYVLAGTLLSILIAVTVGLMVICIFKSV